MSSGKLGTADLAATTITDIYTVPASTVASVNINVCNRNATDVVIRLALSDTSVTQGNDEFIEYDTVISANGVLERGGIMLEAGQIVTVYSDTANVSIVITGIEESV